jgi:DNA (cytosine-5)-methyltransferase 1
MITFADLFAGGGGTSTGAFMVPGIHVSWALNHDPIAIKTHEANHPETKHYQADIREQNVMELDPVDVLWASLECTNHSKAKGGKDKDIGSFMLGWELPRYLVHCRPDYLYIENVPEFIRWGELKDGKRVKGTDGLEYLRWVQAIKDLGYVNYERRFLNAADYGCPTRRIRYFGIFSKPGCPIMWPIPTHAEIENVFGLPKWNACKPHIDLTNEGHSIFGRAENMLIPKNHRKPLVNNSLRRIAGGVKKYAPEVYFIMKYYGNSTEGNNFNCQSLSQPLHTIPTKDRHCLIKVEKMQFIHDYCHTSYYDLPDEPLRTQLTRQTKQLITIKKQFISAQYNSNGKPEANNSSINQPLGTLTTEEKFQFITAYFNSSGHPETQNQSLDRPLNTILTKPNKKALVTAELSDLLDFDIKMRFLTADELASITGFPKGYFKRPGLRLSDKRIIKMIGNAVPVGMAKALLEAVTYVYEQEKIAV